MTAVLPLSLLDSKSRRRINLCGNLQRSRRQRQARIFERGGEREASALATEQRCVSQQLAMSIFWYHGHFKGKAFVKKSLIEACWRLFRFIIFGFVNVTGTNQFSYFNFLGLCRSTISILLSIRNIGIHLTLIAFGCSILNNIFPLDFFQLRKVERNMGSSDVVRKY